MRFVSVIVCCYNGEQFIDHCFSCLMRQTYQALEIIFVDDGSSDNSLGKALEYKSLFEQQGRQLKCLTQKNKGAGGAAALGLLNATGEYISCYDVDDVLYPKSIEKRVGFLDGHLDYKGVRTNGFRIASDGKHKTMFVMDDSEKQKTDIFEDLLLGRTNNWAGSYMVRSAALWEVYPDHHVIESRYGQNLQILMPVAYNNKIGFIDEPLMEYSYNPMSFTNTSKDFNSAYDKLLGYKEIRENILKKLSISDTNIRNKVELCYCRLLMDLSLQYKAKDKFIENYEQAKSLAVPDSLSTYYYYLYRGDGIKALFYRIKNKLKLICLGSLKN